MVNKINKNKMKIEKNNLKQTYVKRYLIRYYQHSIQLSLPGAYFEL